METFDKKKIDFLFGFICAVAVVCELDLLGHWNLSATANAEKKWHNTCLLICPTQSSTTRSVLICLLSRTLVPWRTHPFEIMTSIWKTSNTWIYARYTSHPHKWQFLTICRSHHILTTVTSSPSVIRWWISRVRHCLHKQHLLVGLGVHFAITTYLACPYTPVIIQLCVRHWWCLIVQLDCVQTLPKSLRRFLTNPNNIFVSVNNMVDKEFLHTSKHQLLISTFYSLVNLANQNASLVELAKKVLDIECAREKYMQTAVGGRQVW